MILKLLTGGIDLPNLELRVLHLNAQHSTTMHIVSDIRAELFSARGIVAKEDRQFGDPYETRYDSLSDRLDAIENLIASRALAEDVETLRLKLERVTAEVEDTYSMLAGDLSLSDRLNGLASASAVANLATTVAGLSAKVEALTNTKLAEVKARKAPKKDAAK
ncbi:hypothetical protein HTK96_02920 [Brevundimonas vesicularis]|uniref:hypothetical protein n=1 Tax=Brevundimonas vesicularis TaxID=41276 RepID=UPI001572EA27|nr:hypothetical protein [Brevundimonas vesicularis]NSX32318.1 hypothetical protein [Brevundimonas vesicularis]